MTVSPWRSLLNKDFRLALPWFLGGLGLIIAFDLWFSRASLLGTRLAFSSMLVFAHFIYFPIYLFISLWLEGKQIHLWLYNPCPAWQLILSKLVVGIPFTLLSLGVSGLYPIYLVLGPMNLFGNNPTLDPTAFWSDVGLIVLTILWTSFHLGFFLLAVWSVHRWLRTYMGKWSWVITTVGTLAFLYLLTQWVTSPLHASLFQWGPSAEWKLLGDNRVFEPVYTGEILSDLLMTFAFFFLAQWILEKRMEV